MEFEKSPLFEFNLIFQPTSGRNRKKCSVNDLHLSFPYHIQKSFPAYLKPFGRNLFSNARVTEKKIDLRNLTSFANAFDARHFEYSILWNTLFLFALLSHVNPKKYQKKFFLKKNSLFSIQWEKNFRSLQRFDFLQLYPTFLFRFFIYILFTIVYLTSKIILNTIFFLYFLPLGFIEITYIVFFGNKIIFIFATFPPGILNLKQKLLYIYYDHPYFFFTGTKWR